MMSKTTPPRLPGKLFASFHALYGAFLVFGSCMELAMATIPGVLPDEALAYFAKLHASPWVSGWVLAQNLCTLPLGVAMLIAAIGLWRRDPRAVARTRRTALVMLVLITLGQLVLAVHLYPDLRSGALGVPDGEAFFLVMLLSCVAAAIWPAFVVLLTRRGHA